MSPHDKLRIAAIAILAFVVYANALGGPFVYDDKRQIPMNTLIQEPSLYGKALVSDVWAFKGDGTIAASNYYRPTFVAWLILNFALFGADPAGWHLLNILLHVAVCILAYLLLRSLELSGWVAFAITAIFAVHPVHVESVAWISGSPDLLFAMFFLGSLICGRRAARSGRNSIAYFSSITLYALACGSKEIGLFVLPIYLLVFREGLEAKSARRSDAWIKRTAPFAIVAVAYFAVRWLVIGALAHPVEDSVGFRGAVLTAPLAVFFYLRQIVWPVTLAANYSLRPVAAVDFADFLGPLLAVVLAMGITWYAARRNPIGKFGYLLFALSLLPALNLTAFPYEQLVHDRYLYVPLLGFLIVTVPYIAELLKKPSSDKYARAGAALAALIVVLLSAATFAYNRTWTDERELWRRTVAVDPDSAHSWSQFGAALAERGNTRESIEAFDRSLNVRPTAVAYLGQGRNLLATGSFDRAAGNAQIVIDMPPERLNAYSLFQAYELIAVALSGQGKLYEAERHLREGRRRLPIYSAALTEKIAVILYNQNRKNEALSELRNYRDQARREFLPASKSVFLRLGMLQAELGDNEAATKDLKEFLSLTQRASDPAMLEDRKQAEQLLARLGK